LLDDKVIYETNGTYEIINYYDVDGAIISFYYDEDINDQEIGKDYYYLKNIFGDITQLVDNDGRIVVEYRYDAFGNTISIKEYNDQNLLTALNIALINQYRYRGYHYDSEVNLYYLNSRYYNPEIGRFINADGIIGQVGNIQSTNMFAYCANNPVMFTDSTGYAWWHWGLAVVVVATLIGVSIATFGATAVFSSVILASQGLASCSMGLTVASFAIVGSSLGFVSSVIYAGLSSSSIEEFNDYGTYGLVTTALGAGIGVLVGYGAYSSYNTSGIYSTPKESRPNSSYTQYDSKSDLVSKTYYNNFGQQQVRIDYGHAHYIKGYGYAQPHIHVYDYDFINGIYRRIYSKEFPFY